VVVDHPAQGTDPGLGTPGRHRPSLVVGAVGSHTRLTPLTATVAARRPGPVALRCRPPVVAPAPGGYHRPPSTLCSVEAEPSHPPTTPADEAAPAPSVWVRRRAPTRGAAPTRPDA